MSDSPLTLNLVGTIYQGPPGNDGDPGKSSYESYTETTTDNPVLSEAAWIASLVGKPGDPGDSAYMSYVKTTTESPVKTEAAWVASLKGNPGDSIKGDPGKSSYQSYLDTTSDNPKLTEAQWVESLHGADGKDGTGLNNRQAWATGTTYSPGDYVFADNADGNNSMWILSGTEDYVSTVQPKDDLTHWIEFQAPAGNNGVGLASLVMTYQASTSGTSVPTGAWATTIPAVAKGSFLWTRSTYTLTDDTIAYGYSAAYQGVDGTNGNNGRGVSSATVTYQASASGTTTPTGTWSSTVPAVTKGQFIWTRTVTAYTDAVNPTTTYSVAYFGTDGSAGVGVSSAVTTYQVGTNGTTAPTGTWSSTIPTVAQGSFLWTRTVLTLTDASTNTAYSVAYQGVDGSGGSGSGGTTWLNGTSDPTGTTGAAGNYYNNTSTGVVWYRATTTWATVGVLLPLASTEQAQAATSNLLLMTPAHVREYMEQYGFTSTYMNVSANLNSVTGTTDKTVCFSFDNTTTNSPGTGLYGRGIQFAGGGNYTTQLAIINDTGAMYLRFNSGGTWGSWIPVGGGSVMKASGTGHAAGLAPDPGATAGTTKFLCEDATWKVPAGGSGGGGGTTVYATVQSAQKGLNTSSATPLAMTFGSAGAPPGDSTTAVLYRMTGTLLTQGPTDTAAVFSIKFTGGTEGASLFRMVVRSADATGAIKQVVSNQDSLAVNATSFGDSMVTIEGIIQLNYVNPTGIDLTCQLVSGAWTNILAGSHLTFTPLGKLISS
ncbi:hypothetical protein [Erwinia phage Kuerle]|nr:hypothetical protein [Erwinia phage Kuerle]